MPGFVANFAADGKADEEKQQAQERQHVAPKLIFEVEPSFSRQPEATGHTNQATQGTAFQRVEQARPEAKGTPCKAKRQGHFPERCLADNPRW